MCCQPPGALVGSTTTFPPTSDVGESTISVAFFGTLSRVVQVVGDGRGEGDDVVRAARHHGPLPAEGTQRPIPGRIGNDLARARHRHLRGRRDGVDVEVEDDGAVLVEEPELQLVAARQVAELVPVRPADRARAVGVVVDPEVLQVGGLDAATHIAMRESQSLREVRDDDHRPGGHRDAVHDRLGRHHRDHRRRARVGDCVRAPARRSCTR